MWPFIGILVAYIGGHLGFYESPGFWEVEPGSSKMFMSAAELDSTGPFGTHKYSVHMSIMIFIAIFVPIYNLIVAVLQKISTGWNIDKMTRTVGLLVLLSVAFAGAFSLFWIIF